MHRIDTPTAQKDKFGAGKNGFTRGNPQTGTPSTDLDDDYFDALQEEIVGVIEAAAIQLDKSDRGQLLKAMKKHFQAINKTLTVLAGLPMGANKLPYFTGDNTANQTDLTQVGRDILGKATVAAVLEYLGFGKAVGSIRNGGSFSSCTTYGIYQVSVSDAQSVEGMPSFNGVFTSGTGFLLVYPNETSVLQIYISSNGGECIRFKWGSGSFSPWDFKYSSIYVPTRASLGLGDVGTSQTWVAYNSTDRVNNVVYTNTTGRPIMVSISSGTASTSKLVVDGVAISSTVITGSSGGNLFVGSVIVPAGSTYQLISSAAASAWAELR